MFIFRGFPRRCGRRRGCCCRGESPRRGWHSLLRPAQRTAEKRICLHAPIARPRAPAAHGSPGRHSGFHGKREKGRGARPTARCRPCATWREVPSTLREGRLSACVVDRRARRSDGATGCVATDRRDDWLRDIACPVGFDVTETGSLRCPTDSASPRPRESRVGRIPDPALAARQPHSRSSSPCRALPSRHSSRP